jgi:hypothetical protein
MGSIELARVIVPVDTLDTAIDLATRQFLFRSYFHYLNSEHLEYVRKVSRKKKKITPFYLKASDVMLSNDRLSDKQDII